MTMGSLKPFEVATSQLTGESLSNLGISISIMEYLKTQHWWFTRDDLQEWSCQKDVYGWLKSLW